MQILQGVGGLPSHPAGSWCVDAKILLKDLVYSLGLSISFRVVGSRQVPFNAKDLAEWGPEPRGEVFPLIWDDVAGSTVFSEYIAKEEHSNSSRIYTWECWDEQSHFG